MGTNKMKKKIFLFIFLSSLTLYAQLEYVPVEHKVYSFLERMENNYVIENYNSFEKPKSRKEIASFLTDISKKTNQLTAVDKEILKRYLDEFEFDIKGTLQNSASLFGNESGYKLFNYSEKYIYALHDSSKINLFLNFVGSAQIVANNDRNLNTNYNAQLLQYGGELRGTILNKMGFYLRATNGFYTGERDAAKLNRDVKQSFKFNEKGTGTYFDETYGYVTADFDLLRLKFGRDRLDIGYGEKKMLIDDNSPPFEYLSFDLKYKALSFSYFHGKLLGSATIYPDTVFDSRVSLADKYIGFHRFGIDFSRDFTFGVGEVIIYANRSADFSYLNPFAFYKSVEHANQDRDNSMLFFDFANNSIKGLKLYAIMLLDDMTFGKIGNGWYGNQTGWNFGAHVSCFDKFLPLDVKLEYQRYEPYVFTHHIENNNFTNNGFPLSSNAQPNSELIFTQFNYRLKYNLSFSFGIQYGVHGANILNDDGSVKQNVGGDINLGHRLQDSETVKFLDGNLEHKRTFSLAILYEPYYDISLSMNMIYINNSLAANVSEKQLQSFFTISAKL
jgi:hypothetical protein